MERETDRQTDDRERESRQGTRRRGQQRLAETADGEIGATTATALADKQQHQRRRSARRADGAAAGIADGGSRLSGRRGLRGRGRWRRAVEQRLRGLEKDSRGGGVAAAVAAATARRRPVAAAPARQGLDVEAGGAGEGQAAPASGRRWRDGGTGSGAVTTAASARQRRRLGSGNGAVMRAYGKPGERKWGLPLKGSWGKFDPVFGHCLSHQSSDNTDPEDLTVLAVVVY
ncbi:hypothetical protein Scep_007373 [Stephania cephalantha]|uniref:Uncharacterized protein n=1 Tax=Stephania cephalantha TaxID=152367 RepID=A0AAP0PPZ3_9MAGN